MTVWFFLKIFHLEYLYHTCIIFSVPFYAWVKLLKSVPLHVLSATNHNFLFSECVYFFYFCIKSYLQGLFQWEKDLPQKNMSLYIFLVDWSWLGSTIKHSNLLFIKNHFCTVLNNSNFFILSNIKSRPFEFSQNTFSGEKFTDVTGRILKTWYHFSKTQK